MSAKSRQLFGQALDLPEGQREQWLRLQCGEDHALFGAVCGLMRADAAASLLDGDVAELAEPLVTGIVDREAGNSAQHVGAHFGPYIVRLLLGRGGMGSVWLAERDDGGFQQRVAIKLMASALPSDEALQRFAQERQILAKLQHPNIARVLDGGAVEGAPWFAMDYVEGVALDEYAKRHALPIEEKLRLFCKVVNAVQFAHQNLVVHRDLKPSNILVDGGGDPHLLDFGVAKLLDEGIELTASRAPLSMAYAAPEQIVGKTITTATDIYSLGVILYQLLSGSRPYKNKGNGTLALMQAITDTDPEPPSRATATQTAGESRRLKGDLDTIVLKCLSRDPTRRYASAAALAGDITRHIDGLPIDARPDSPGYRLGKFVRRHRLGTTLAAAATLALLATTAISFHQAQRAEDAARRASAERDVARAETRQQEALSEHFGAVLNLAVASGEQVAVSQLLGWAGDPRLLGDFGDARMQRTIELAVSDILVQSNDFPGALKLLDALAPVLTQVSLRDRLQALANRAIAQIRTGALDAAAISLNQAQALLPSNDRGLMSAMLRNYRSQWLRARGQLAEAAVAARESGEWAAVAEDGSPVARGRIVGGAANGLLQLGELKSAVELADAALRIWREADVSQNASTPSTLAVAANARFLRGEIAPALAQLDALAADSTFADSAPSRAARDASRAKALALLDQGDAALALIERAATSMCDAVGRTSLDCLRMRLSQVDTARIAGDLVVARHTLDAVRAQLALQPMPPLQALVDRFAQLLIVLADPQPAVLDPLLAELGAPGQIGLAQLGAVRNLLVLAEQLHASGHRAAAAKSAGAAITAAVGLDEHTGMDHSLLRLWRARLASEAAPIEALNELANAIGAAHPWVVAHQQP